MKRIAIYGKGGIGKSTVSANLSAAFALAGAKVLQVGCDPKHDSTRFLLRGRRLTTVLEYMRATRPADQRLSDILAVGFAGVGCVEAGGPKPGVGCAGRGIISTFELLDSFHLFSRNDITIYDVLGDVVCGGFAVPIRREYADTILIVTSGEFMALYAANNILRGIRNYDGDQGRVAGLVLNRRGLEEEELRVRRFAEAVGLPLFADLPRSEVFAQAEARRVTPMELRTLRTEASDELDRVCAIFDDMAGRLPAAPLHPAAPLSDGALEEVILGSAARPAGEASPAANTATVREDAPPDGAACAKAAAADDLPDPDATRYLSKNLYPGAALQGCAFNGAVSTAVHLADAAVLAHAPKSCAYIVYQSISSGGRRALYTRGTQLPLPLVPDLSCTDMGEPEIVFGGMEKLQAEIEKIRLRQPKAIVVISSCPAGIIGDDIDRVRELSSPDIPVIPVRADGNMAGDFMQGTLMAHRLLAEALIDPQVPVAPDSVNILGEKGAVTNTEANFSLVRSLLAAIDVRIGCRFLCNTTTEALRNFCAAPLTLPAYSDYTTRVLGDYLSDCFGANIFSRAFPVGFDDTAEWLREIADFFDGTGAKRAAAEEIIAVEEEKYRRAIEALRPSLSGKRLMVITYNHELDWVLRTAIDAGMKLVKIGARDYSQDEGFRTRLKQPLPVEENYDLADLEKDIAALRPDVLLTTYATEAGKKVPVADTIPMCPDIGFDTGIKTAERWARLLAAEQKGGWMQDEVLFRKHYG